MHVAATRSELLARRAHIALARQGRDLLKEKRTMLRREFDRLSASVLRAMETLEERCAQGRALLGHTVAVEGPEAIGSAALAAAGRVELDRRSKLVAGVPVEEIHRSAVRRPRTGRGYGFAGSSARVDMVAEAFEGQIDLLLDVVATELSLRRLAEEISVTTRRVNALEQVVIPRLEAERDYVEMVLEERELEDHVRLLRARTHRDRRQQAARS
ncbi:MAG: V-type ATP synthase subunit D [Nocardioidaceae bacterium]